ncbi:uncharacterized protein LOC117099809, partial [Anneissia japonica]|uniref:uncharacterized protein LOC117099809 n=1 Tax=Anneissia japonica TaxID=1529436 RepID=UPI0014257DD6
YYYNMRALLQSRVPPVVEPSPNPPTPLANTVLDMILRPLNTNIETGPERSQFISLRRLALCHLCESFLRTAFTEQVAHFILPALCEKRTNFPVVELLESLLPSDLMEINQNSQQGLNQMEVEPSPWLLFSVLSLGTPIISEFVKLILQ